MVWMCISVIQINNMAKSGWILKTIHNSIKMRPSSSFSTSSSDSTSTSSPSSTYTQGIVSIRNLVIVNKYCSIFDGWNWFLLSPWTCSRNNKKGNVIKLKEKVEINIFHSRYYTTCWWRSSFETTQHLK